MFVRREQVGLLTNYETPSYSQAIARISTTKNSAAVHYQVP